MVPNLQSILSTTCVCARLSLSLFYRILGLPVSPSFEQELHNCGVTIDRGPHECGEAMLQILKVEAHTKVTKRDEN